MDFYLYFLNYFISVFYNEKNFKSPNSQIIGTNIFQSLITDLFCYLFLWETTYRG